MLSDLNLTSTRLISLLHRLALKFRPLGDLSHAEKLEAFIQPPWQETVPYTILPRDKAIPFAQNTSSHAIFTDSSACNGLIGVGIHNPNIAQFLISSTTMATTDIINVFAGELMAIDIALAQLFHLSAQNSHWFSKTIILFTDSQAAIKALKYPTGCSGQFLIKSITLKFHQLKAKGILCEIHWSPAHSKIPGNMQAHNLAQLATSPNSTPISLSRSIVLLSVIKQRAHLQIPAPDSKALFMKATVGRFIKSFDKALPGKHTTAIYSGRTKKYSQILCQLRTGICRLNSYLAKIQAVDSDQCRCNRGCETVDHFLFRCPRWSNLRQEFKRLAANRWGDLSHALGGWSGERKDGPLDKWTPSTAMVSATVNFAIATGRLEDRKDEENEEESEEELSEGEEVGT